MKCGKLMYVDMSFSLVLLPVSNIKHVIFYLCDFFNSSFINSKLCASNFVDLALILECSLRPVLGFPPVYVMQLGTTHSFGVPFLYCAFGWPVISERAGIGVQLLGITLLSEIKIIIPKYISILKALRLVPQNYDGG